MLQHKIPLQIYYDIIMNFRGTSLIYLISPLDNGHGRILFLYGAHLATTLIAYNLLAPGSDMRPYAIRLGPNLSYNIPVGYGMPRHLNLRQIEAFKALIESGTVSRGASLLNISQPAMSKLIAHLEFDTELKLFNRVKGRLAPTEHAMRLYEEIGRIFAGVRQVEGAVDAIRREEQGRVAVGVLAALSGSFIQRVTTAFLEKHGNVFCSVESLSSPWIVDRLVSRKLDIGLVSNVIDNPYVTREPLMKHALVCIMAPDHPLTAKTVIEPQDLNGKPFVAFHRDTDIVNLIDNVLETYGVRPDVGLVSNVTPTVCEFVAAGLGVAIVHPLSLSGFEKRLVARRFEPEIPYHFQLCRSADSRNAQLVEAFAQVARAMALQISSSMLIAP